MNNIQINQYRPDYVSAPGETLADILEERGLSQSELAERTGRPLKTINEIIKGKTALTPDTSIQLERVLGIVAEFWNQREANYRSYLARNKERADLDSHSDWLKEFPIRDMINRGWIPDSRKSKTSQIIQLLNFFGVATPDQWVEGWTKQRLAFRKSMKLPIKVEATCVWLRKGEIEAEKIECKPYSREKLLAALPVIRKLTLEKDPKKFKPVLKNILSDVGIAIVFVEPFVGISIYGASKWLTASKAMIQLSGRGKYDDLFWFTLFHELNHILHHSKKELFVHFDKKTEVPRGPEEDEADKHAEEQLLPSADFENWMSKHYNIAANDVIAFAKEQGISPGIVVGRLANRGHILYSNPLCKLRVSFDVVD